MADVERGQLILVTALAISVTLVALVLLLNTVIYAENLATRGADVGGQDAVEYRGAVVRGVGGVIDAENQQDHASHAAVRENLSAAVERVDGLLARQHLRRAELTEVSNLTMTNGTILRHPEDTDSFPSAAGTTTWTLAAAVPATRGFVMTVDRSDVTGSGTADAFQVVLDDGDGSTDPWIAYVYDDGDLTVAVKNATDASATVACTADGANATIDFTRGTMDGEPCPGLAFGKGLVSSYSIAFVNGDAAGGTYELTVLLDPDTDANVQANFNDPDSGTAPYYAYAVYDATVDVRYRTDALRFADEIRVAPGEPT